MAERTKGWAAAAITILAAVVIGGGFAITGGPMQGRKEAHDRVRLHDLNEIATQAECHVLNKQPLQAEVTTSATCPNMPREADPYTGKAYRIELVDSENLRLCATFQLSPEKREDWVEMSYDRPDEEGCIVRRITRPAPEPPLGTVMPPDIGERAVEPPPPPPSQP